MDQHVSDVVRGQDLLSSTGRQILLQQALGAKQPRYSHIPLILQDDGRKLSKQNGAAEIDWQRAPQQCIKQALHQLGQDTIDGSLSEILQYAVCHWSPVNIFTANKT